jgi:hypothetical protein
MNDATKWFGLAVLALTIGPMSTARAGLVLGSAQLTDTETGVYQEEGVGPQRYYGTVNTFTQLANQATISDPLNTQAASPDGGLGFISSTNSGSASVSPGSPSSFANLVFSLTSAGISANSPFTISTEQSMETYSAQFTPDATGVYQLTMAVNSSGGGFFTDGQIIFGTLSGATLFSLDTATEANGGPLTMTEQVTLTQGVTYTVSGFTNTLGIVNDLVEPDSGVFSGDASAMFSLSTPSSVPEPSSLVLLAGMGTLVGLRLAWRRVR